jgi:hypothetical protein
MRILLLTLLLVCGTAYGQNKNERQIRQTLQTQAEHWNRGDIEKFMQPYWHSDSLMFIGKSGVQRGWTATLNNYRKSYPDATAMGKLAFDIIEIRKLSKQYYWVVGKWMLTRTAGNLSGHFNLLFRKMGGHWVIVADHSS